MVCGTGIAADAPEAGPATPAAAPEPDDRDIPDMRRAPEGAPALEMSADFTSPAMTFGGYFPVPQMESGAIRVEPFTVRAAINAGLGYDDNVTLARSNQISSMFLTVTPAVVVGLEGANHRYYAAYRGNYGRYFESSADNYENHNIVLTATDEWTTRLRTQGVYEFTRGTDPRGSTGSTTARAATWNLNRLRGNASYGAAGAQGRLDGFVTYTKREYTDSGGVSDPRNYDQVDIGGTFGYRVAPKTTTTLTLQHSNITHPEGTVLDATENRYLVGVNWAALEKTQGQARIGYLTRSATNSGASDFSSPTYEVNATWTPLTYSVVNVVATRTSAEAVEAGSRFIVVDLATVTWTHAWFERVRSTFRGLYGQQRHEGISRTDVYYSLGGRLSYALGPRLRIGAEFRHDSRSSPDATFEYKRNLTLLTVESSL
jgi:hypothetical protein